MSNSLRHIGRGEKPDRMINIARLAAVLGVSDREAGQLVRDGVVPAIQYGAEVLIDPRCLTQTLRDEVDRWSKSSQ